MLVDLEAAGVEPRADVVAVAHQEVHPLRVGDDVNDLGQVDDDDPVTLGEDVVRRQVAVRDARRARSSIAARSCS